EASIVDFSPRSLISKVAGSESKISTALFALAVATPTPGMARPAATIPATALTATNCMNAPILVGVGFDSGDTMRASLTNSPCAVLQKPLSDWVLGTRVSRLTSGRQEKRTGE